MLQERLRELPTELEEYFRLMLDSVERVYHKSAAQIYLIRLSAPGPVALLTLSYFDERDSDFAIQNVITPYKLGQIKKARSVTLMRVKERCTDLLEVFHGSKVDFLHRTVYNFLETNDVHDLLLHRVGSDFDPHLYGCSTMLAKMKQVPKYAGDGEINGEFDPPLSTFVEDFEFHVQRVKIRNLPLRD